MAFTKTHAKILAGMLSAEAAQTLRIITGRVPCDGKGRIRSSPSKGKTSMRYALILFAAAMLTSCNDEPNKTPGEEHGDYDYAFLMGMTYQQALDAPAELQCPLFVQAEALADAYKTLHLDIPAIAARNKQLQTLRDKCKKETK